jgi:hypothetical protein
MKEYRLIQVKNVAQMQIHQESKGYSRVRTSQSKDPYSSGNKTWQATQLMKEYSLIQARHKMKTLIQQYDDEGRKISSTEVNRENANCPIVETRHSDANCPEKRESHELKHPPEMISTSFPIVTLA